jgi:hypothetical protein
MKVHFEDEDDAKAFLEFCRLIAKVMEENEKWEKISVLRKFPNKNY